MKPTNFSVYACVCSTGQTLIRNFLSFFASKPNNKNQRKYKEREKPRGLTTNTRSRRREEEAAPWEIGLGERSRAMGCSALKTEGFAIGGALPNAN